MKLKTIRRALRAGLLKPTAPLPETTRRKHDPQPALRVSLALHTEDGAEASYGGYKRIDVTLEPGPDGNLTNKEPLYFPVATSEGEAVTRLVVREGDDLTGFVLFSAPMAISVGGYIVLGPSVVRLKTEAYT